MSRHIAIYVRVSTSRQDTRSQEPDLQRWIEAFANGTEVVWYRDKFSGRTMDRPGWNRLQAAIDASKVTKVVVWRLDRLGRTAAGLTALFEEFQRRVEDQEAPHVSSHRPDAVGISGLSS